MEYEFLKELEPFALGLLGLLAIGIVGFYLYIWKSDWTKFLP